jgi:hypothetical protein
MTPRRNPESEARQKTPRGCVRVVLMTPVLSSVHEALDFIKADAQHREVEALRIWMKPAPPNSHNKTPRWYVVRPCTDSADDQILAADKTFDDEYRPDWVYLAAEKHLIPVLIVKVETAILRK